MLDNIKKVQTPNGQFDYLQQLNYDQQTAATQIEGNNLVLAGPGTGKTYTLAYRTLHLVNQGVNPKHICLITFTRKAASSLRKRLEELLPNVELGFIGTFHALATNILSEANHLNSWRLIDADDDLKLIDITCLSEPLGSAKLKQIFSYYTNTKKPIKEVLSDLNLEMYNHKSNTIEEAYHFYQATKQRLNYLNYDDLLLLPITNNEFVKKLNIEHLMIDEYQDVTKLQVDFIKCLPAKNIMAIGDDFQNIYRFRGTDNKLILDFGIDFPNSKLITFKTNYRFTVNIAASVNKVVDKTKFGYPKYVWSSREDDDENANVTIHSGLEDSTSIIINTLKQNTSKKHAVLYRRSKMRAKIEQALIENKIAYQIYGALNLLEREHIKDLLAIISLINNPNDFLAHIHILLKDEAIDEKMAVELVNKVGFKQEIDIITSDLIDFKLRTIEQVVDLAIDYYTTHINNSGDDDVHYDFSIIRNLATNYDYILSFLNDFTLDYKVDFKSADTVQEQVVLSTIHASKGLEFDNVHILYGFNKFREMSIDQLQEEARLFYVAMSRAKDTLTIYDNFSKKRTLNDIINDFLDSPLYEDFELTYDDDEISDVTKVTLHLDQDEIKTELSEQNLKLGLKSVIDFFKK